MRIVITNDDGVAAEGIVTLTTALHRTGEHDIVVVAPAVNMSGMSAALGPIDLGSAITVAETEIAGCHAYAVAAPPALGVYSAMQGAFGPPPEIVVSGINAGLNTGKSVLHSGTVGACMTAATLGIPSMAVSVDESHPWHFDTAAEVAVLTLGWTIEHATAGSVVNVNVPGVPQSQLLGIRWAGLDRFGAVQTSSREPGEHLQFELRSSSHMPDPGSDHATVAEGYASVTLLCPVTAVALEGLAPLEPLQVARRAKAAPPVDEIVAAASH